MNTWISDQWEPFIRSQVQSGRFASADAVVDEALRRFKEQEQEQEQAQEAGEHVSPTAPQPVPAWKRVMDNMQQVPDEVFDSIPADGSEQLDHYIYGTPKR